MIRRLSADDTPLLLEFLKELEKKKLYTCSNLIINSIEDKTIFSLHNIDVMMSNEKIVAVHILRYFFPIMDTYTSILSMSVSSAKDIVELHEHAYLEARKLNMKSMIGIIKSTTANRKNPLNDRFMKGFIRYGMHIAKDTKQMIQIREFKKGDTSNIPWHNWLLGNEPSKCDNILFRLTFNE
jgi:hypothetical protein